jgi:hypothetical protein
VQRVPLDNEKRDSLNIIRLFTFYLFYLLMA